MPLQKILFKPGVNRENTRYTTEGGWYECDKVRFRQGNPEQIGGWERISIYTYEGVCRSLWNWVTLSNVNLVSVGTNLKFYIEQGGVYNDITPIRTGAVLSNPFDVLLNSPIITVHDINHGCITGDFVTFSNANSVGGINMNKEWQVTVIDVDTYTVTAATNSNATNTGVGGAAVNALYQINTGPEYQVPLTGWGAGAWGSGSWGQDNTSINSLRVWSQTNYGEDLIYGYRGGPIYYWSAVQGIVKTSFTVSIASPAVFTSTATLYESAAIIFTTTGELPTGLSVGTIYYVRNYVGGTFNVSTTPTSALITTSGTQSGTHYILPNGIDIAQFSGANACPIIQNYIFVSDTSRFVFAFGANELGTSVQDPMLVRWSDQENFLEWFPQATNQAGSIRLSHGSEIVTAIQTRQEIVVVTDSAIYSFQYLGPPYVWGNTLLADNISIAGQNAIAVGSGVVYWMGVDKFYMYDGRVQTLSCDLRRYIFDDINLEQNQQIFAGTNEGFNEVWWFYCSANSIEIDKYVVYNYLEKVWYYGTMQRSAWLDSGLRNYPLAATYAHNLVNHENGINDNVTGNPVAIQGYIASSEFDINDGHNFGFVWRILPDLTFSNSTTAPNGNQPQVTMTLYGLYNSGSGVIDYAGKPVNKIATYNITEEFNGQIYTRMRGRQMIFKIESNQLNTTWQLGAPRIDIRPDGRR